MDSFPVQEYQNVCKVDTKSRELHVSATLELHQPKILLEEFSSDAASSFAACDLAIVLDVAMVVGLEILAKLKLLLVTFELQKDCQNVLECKPSSAQATSQSLSSDSVDSKATTA